MVMDDSMRTGGVHLHFAGEKLQSPLRFSRSGLWSYLDPQAPVKTKILVSVEICWSREAGSSDVGNAGKDKFL